MHIKKSICLVFLLIMTSDVFAGNIIRIGAAPQGGGMRHDPGMEEYRRRIDEDNARRRAQEEADRQVQERFRVEEERARQRREAEADAARFKAEQDRIERQRIAAEQERERIRREIVEHQRAIEARRVALEQQRRDGTIRVETLTGEEILDAMNHEQDPVIKEYWATMILIIDHENQIALDFLRNDRGWAQSEIDGLIGQ